MLFTTFIEQGKTVFTGKTPCGIKPSSPVYIVQYFICCALVSKIKY